MEGRGQPCRTWEQQIYWNHFDHTRMHFFKVLLGDFSQQLHIPQKFVTLFKEQLPESVKLKGPSTNIWDIKLKRSDSGVCFEGGWNEFVENHKLELGDFLVFRYKGKSCFKVKIFDKSGCEKEQSYFIKKNASTHLNKGSAGDETREKSVEPLHVSPSDRKCSSKDASTRKSPRRSQTSVDTQKCGTETMSAPIRKRPRNDLRPSRRETRSMAAAGHQENLANEMSNSKDAPTRNAPKRSETSVDTLNPEAKTTVAPFCKRSRGYSKPLEQKTRSASANHPEHSPDEMSKAGNDQTSSRRTYSLILQSNRRRVTNKERKNAYERAKAVESTSPSFIAVMRATNVYKGFAMAIPAEFAAEYLPRRSHSTILRTTKGKKWQVNVCCYSHVVRFGGGWRLFALDNNLEEDDVCVFELETARNGSRSSRALDVKIFRVVEDVVPPIVDPWCSPRALETSWKKAGKKNKTK